MAGLIMLAILAVIVSKNSSTSGSLTAGFGALTGMIQKAMNPLAGGH